MVQSYESICQTAYFVALLRAKLPLPYCQEIAEAINAEAINAEAINAEAMIDESFRQKLNDPDVLAVALPALEARTRMVQRCVEECHVNQVFEVPGGLSPLSLSRVADYPTGLHVEMDLKPMHHAKQQVFQALGIVYGNVNIKLMAGNALDDKDVARAMGYFDPDKPMAMAVEGLVPYFSHKEKIRLFELLRTYLTHPHSRIVVTDIMDSASMSSAGSMKEVRDMVGQMTDRSLDDNVWPTELAANKFFLDQGFHYQPRRLSELASELTSINLLGLNQEVVRQQLHNRRVFVLWRQ